MASDSDADLPSPSASDSDADLPSPSPSDFDAESESDADISSLTFRSVDMKRKVPASKRVCIERVHLQSQPNQHTATILRGCKLLLDLLLRFGAMVVSELVKDAMNDHINVRQRFMHTTEARLNQIETRKKSRCKTVKPVAPQSESEPRSTTNTIESLRKEIEDMKGRLATKEEKAQGRNRGGVKPVAPQSESEPRYTTNTIESLRVDIEEMKGSLATIKEESSRTKQRWCILIR